MMYILYIYVCVFYQIVFLSSGKASKANLLNMKLNKNRSFLLVVL